MRGLNIEALTLALTVPDRNCLPVSDFIAANCDLSKSRIKDAMIKGALHCKKPNTAKYSRLRKAKEVLPGGTILRFHYDPQILAIEPPQIRLVDDGKIYSVWYKPAGLLTQGNLFGDHCSLLRLVALFYNNTRQVFPVHRLDRETDGIIVVAHDKNTAAQLSRQFQEQTTRKIYKARVSGCFDATRNSIAIPLSGKEALTRILAVRYDGRTDTTELELTIKTGRTHQIRRHLAMVGHPVLGDPQYGTGNKNDAGLMLTATTLQFRCPRQRQMVTFSI